MNKFMNDDFLLTCGKARELYSEVKDLPIFDYHCHLSPKEIYLDKTFHNLTELWLEADHYKWRVMRNAGIDENLITGDAAPYDKFFAFASALPGFAGNPVYHWAHLELKKYFGLDIPLSVDTAKAVWDETKRQMSGGAFSARKLIENSNVDTVVTTDDPIDDLNYHKKIAADGVPFKVLPCFRADKILNIEADGFAVYVGALSDASGVTVDGFDSLLRALDNRAAYFKECGAVAADCSFADFPNAEGDRHRACLALKERLAGGTPDAGECAEYRFAVLTALAAIYRKYDFVMQMHTAVLRNQNSTRFAAVGADCGIDSLASAVDIASAGRLFDKIETESGLPKTIVYTLNPNSYYPLATMLGDFAGESRGKMQLGAAWWFLDHRDGIREQLKVFANTSGLGLFNGMLTDSRSFVTYARHDYFRRVLCSVVGEWIEDGEYPEHGAAELVKNVSYFNAKHFFGC